MVDIIILIATTITTALVLPMVIMKTRFRWIDKHLCGAWMYIFIFYSILFLWYYGFKPETVEVIMKLNFSHLWGIFIFGLIGFLVFASYYILAEKLSSPSIPTPPPPPKPMVKSIQQDSIDIRDFDSKVKIVLYNSWDREIFISSLKLQSVEHGVLYNIFIGKKIKGKTTITYDLKESNVDLSKWGVRSISQESWQQLLKNHLKENECIQWRFLIPSGDTYKIFKEHFGNSLREVPINATLSFYSEADGHQINRDLKIVAVPLLNQTCVSPDGTAFRFQ